MAAVDPTPPPRSRRRLLHHGLLPLGAQLGVTPYARMLRASSTAARSTELPSFENQLAHKTTEDKTHEHKVQAVSSAPYMHVQHATVVAAHPSPP